MKNFLIKCRVRFDRFSHDVSGATLIEYAVLIGLMLAVSIGIFLTIGGQISNIFGDVQNNLATTPANTP